MTTRLPVFASGCLVLALLSFEPLARAHEPGTATGQAAAPAACAAAPPPLEWHPTSIETYREELRELERREVMARQRSADEHTKALAALVAMRADFERDTTRRSPVARGIGIGLFATGGVALVTALVLAISIQGDPYGFREDTRTRAKIALGALGGVGLAGGTGTAFFIYGNKRVMREEQARPSAFVRLGLGTLHLEGTF